MINLTGAKVGEKFLDDANQVIELIMLNKNKYKDEYLFRYESTNQLLLAEVDGKARKLGHCSVASKVDLHPWLKDLPDADLFSRDVVAIKFCEDNGWVYTMVIGDARCWYQINVIKMPTLMGDQWKLSKISIEDLRGWQKSN